MWNHETPRKKYKDKLHDTDFGYDFEFDTENKDNKSKKKKSGISSNWKNFCTAKQTMNKMKRQLSEREKKSSNHIPDKGLATKIY